MKFRVGSTILGPDPSRQDKKTVAACDELLQILVSSGWEPLSEKGTDWWSFKFRRPVKQLTSGNIQTDSDEEAHALAAEFLSLFSGMLERKEYNQIISTSDNMMKIIPDFNMLYYYRGRAYTGLEQYQKAIVEFDRAIQLGPKFAEAYFYRGAANLFLKQFQKAITDFDRTLELNPNHPNAKEFRATAYKWLK